MRQLETFHLRKKKEKGQLARNGLVLLQRDPEKSEQRRSRQAQP